MKKYLAFLLLLCLVLTGCKAKETNRAATKESSEAPTTQATEAPTQPEQTEPPTQPEDTEPPTEPSTQPPVVLYRHPLTGAPLEEPFTGRPVAFSVGNTIAALPQHGISQADLFFEIEAEGDITRFLAVITDLEAVPAIGPIRSARTFFNSVAAACNAPISHCGGSNRGILGYHDPYGSKIANWEHFDQFTYGDKYYHRDLDRYNYQGYAWEHCLFTTGQDMIKALADQKYQGDEAWDLGLSFADDAKVEGDAATSLSVHFRGGKHSDFAYDATTGLYSIRQYDRELIDGNTGKQLTFRNLFVLYAEQTKKRGGSYIRSYYDLLGEGEGYFALDGKITKILWSREDVKSPFVFTYEDGTPVTLGVGQSYIAISATTSKTVTYK